MSNIYIDDDGHISQRSIVDWVPKKIASLTKKVHQLDLNHKNILLLSDDQFNFFSQNLNYYQKDKFTISQFKDILSHIKKDLKWKIDININSNNYLIDNIYINNEKQIDLFGHNGNMSWDINILSPHKLFPCKTLPQSLWIIKYIHKTQNKNNFAVLYINDKKTKLITTKNWFYDNINEINLWINQIKKDMIEDNAIQAMYDNNLNNIVTKKILNEHYTYFNKLLWRRLSQHIKQWQDVYLSSKLSKSEIFMSIMKKNLTNIWWWYIIPFGGIVPSKHQHNIHLSTMILSGLI